MTKAALYPRFIEANLTEALIDSPAVLLHGPRQCGKTTLAHTVCGLNPLTWRDEVLTWRGEELTLGTHEYQYISFDDDVVRGSAATDPMGFVADLPERVILDEVQRVPELFTALKMEIDRRRIPGRFLLMGSTHVLLASQIADSLAGRLQTLRLHPLAQCELERCNSDFLDTLFGKGFKVGRSERLGKRLAERVVAGGYPVALARPTGRRRANWYRDYIDALVRRDVRDIARISRLEELPRLLRASAVQTASLFNVSNLAKSFQLSLPTIRNYVTLLERVFLLERLQSWHNNRLKRLVKTPKLHIGDTGLAATLLGVDASALMVNRALLGQLLETFVFQELWRQASWHDAHIEFFHFRDKDGAEVDIVIERGALAVAGVEIKAGATVRSADFRGLGKLASAAGECFAGGVVLYDGEATTPFGDRLYAVPVRRLWETT